MIEVHNYYQNPEYQKAIHFLAKGCECDCSEQVPKEKYAKLRVQFQNLSKTSQDTFVMAQLLTMKEGDWTFSFPKRQRINLRISFRWDNKTPICKETYINSLGISKKYLKIIAHEIVYQGLTERVHGNTGRTPHWKTKLFIDKSVKEKVKNFIENYAERHGSPKSERTKRATNLIILLPTEMTYKSVHQDFINNLKEDDKLKVLKYETFLKLWHNLTPHIKFLNPRTDLCNTCHQFRNELHSCQDEKEAEANKKNFDPIKKKLN